MDTAANTVTYNLAGTQALDAFRSCAGSVAEVATERTAEVNAHRQAEAGLVEMGKAQRRIADLRAQELAEERRSRVWRELGYWVVIGLLGAAAL